MLRANQDVLGLRRLFLHCLRRFDKKLQIVCKTALPPVVLELLLGLQGVALRPLF